MDMILACMASVSNRVTSRNLERERKKWKGEGERGGEKEGEGCPFLSSPLPSSSLFFALVSTTQTRAETLASRLT